METAKTVCPNCWKWPDQEGWKRLVETAGGRETAGRKLRSKSGWNKNGNGIDYYVFSALPGGYRDYSDGSFYTAGNRGLWWTVTESYYIYAYLRNMGYLNDYMTNDNYEYYKDYGYSVRCVKDTP